MLVNIHTFDLDYKGFIYIVHLDETKEKLRMINKQIKLFRNYNLH